MESYWSYCCSLKELSKVWAEKDVSHLRLCRNKHSLCEMMTCNQSRGILGKTPFEKKVESHFVFWENYLEFCNSKCLICLGYLLTPTPFDRGKHTVNEVQWSERTHCKNRTQRWTRCCPAWPLTQMPLTYWVSFWEALCLKMTLLELCHLQDRTKQWQVN